MALAPGVLAFHDPDRFAGVRIKEPGIGHEILATPPLKPHGFDFDIGFSIEIESCGYDLIGLDAIYFDYRLGRQPRGEPEKKAQPRRLKRSCPVRRALPC
jgi:hypothetical protein